VVNRAERDDFKADSYEKMQAVIGRLMSQSNLKYRGDSAFLYGIFLTCVLSQAFAT
jgi:hypothetical protein